MNTKNDCKNCKIYLSEPLKAIRESACTIRRKINYMNSRPQKAGKYAQLLFEDTHGLLASLSYVLKHSYHHAKSRDEIHDVRQTQDMVKQAHMELEQTI